MSITLEQAEKDLSELLEKEKLCIFAGSGVSVDPPSSLPTWDGFIDKYKEICEKICKSSKLNKFDEIINNVDAYKKHDTIATITALRDIIASCEKSGSTMTLYNSLMIDIFANKGYSNYHKAIINTNYKYILTTNYDNLLEKAALDDEYNELLKRVYTQDNINMISEAFYKKEPAVIHMHGTYDNIKLREFILTKEDFKHYLLCV